MASDIVVNKVIRYSAEDKLSSVAERINKLVDAIAKNKVTKFEADTTDEQKINQYESKLQGLPKDIQTQLKAIADRGGFSSFESYLNTLPKNIQTELKTKFDKQALEAVKRDYGSLPKEKKTKLEAIAEKAGYDSFKTMYDRVPKEARTQLDFVANQGDFSKIKSAISDIAKPVSKKVDINTSSVDVATKKFSHLKEIIAGTFAGQLITNGVNSLASGLKSATAAGMEYNKEQDTMKTVWTSLTTEAPKDGKELVNYINSLSQHSIYAADTINKMSQSFYHVHSNVAETKDWTNSFIALGSTLHMSNDALAESGEQFAKIVAGGKASSEDMAVMINRFPMFGEALQKATGKSMKQLYEMSAKGKLSAEQFTETLSYLGKKYAGGTQEAMTSYMGMGMYIHSRFSKLTGDIMSQTFNTTKSASGAIRDLLSDDAMQKYSKAIGSATTTVLNGIGDIIKYIDGHKDTIMKIGKDVGEIASIFGRAVWNDMKSVMTVIAEKFGLVDKNAKSSADPLKTFESILSAVAKHKTAIANIAAAFVAIKGFKLAKGIFDPLLKVAGLQSKGGGLLTKVIGSGKNEKTVFRFGTEGLADSKQKITNFMSFMKKITQGGKFSKINIGDMSKGAKIGTAATTVGVGAVAGMDIVGAIKAKNPEKKFEGFGKAAGGAIGGGIGFMLGGPAGEAVGALIGRTLGKYGGKAAKQFTDGWNKAGKGAKPPKGMIPKAGYYARKATDSAVEWTQSMAKGISKDAGKVGKGFQSVYTKSTDFAKKHKTEILTTMVSPFAGVGAWFLKDTKTGKNVSKWMSGLTKSVAKDTKDKKGITGKITGAFQGVGDWFKKDKKTSKAVETWSKGLSNVFSGKNSFAKGFQKELDSMSKSLKKSKFGKSWDSFWKDTQKTTQSWDKNISKWWSGFSKDFGKKWDQSWKDRKTGMQDAWKGMHSAYDNFATGMNKWWSGFSSDFAKKWNQTWKDRQTNIHDNFKNMHSAYDDFTTGIDSWWSGFSSRFKSGWDAFWKGVQKLFKDIFGTFKDMAHDAMKGVVGAINGGIGGINTVIHFFGGKAQSIAPIKYAAGVGYHPGGPALINDQKGSVYEEAFKNPGEPWRIIPKMRNVMVDLKPGATVVPANETAARFAPSSVPHYAGGVGSWIKGELGDMGKWVKDKLEGITSFLKDPLGNLTAVWDKATSKFTQPTKFGGVFAPPAGHYVVKQSVQWFKDQMNKLKDKELEAQSVAGEPKAAQAWLPIVAKILKDMGAHPPKGIDWEAAAFVREIARESGGNPTIRQTISDSNSAAGNPAQGLLQFIPSTFLAYAVPGHTNILSGEDQIMATANAYMHSGAWDRIGTGRQINFLANGGHFSSATPAIIGEDGDEFAINPSKPSAIPLIGDLMGRVADFHPEFRTSNLTGNISGDIGRKLDQVINLLGSIDNKNFAPEVNIARTSSNFNQQNRRDTDIYAYQQGRRQ